MIELALVMTIVGFLTKDSKNNKITLCLICLAWNTTNKEMIDETFVLEQTNKLRPLFMK